MTHADRLLGICPEADLQPVRWFALGRWCATTALLLGCVGCRIRDDVPPAPSSSASIAPSSAPTASVASVADAAAEAPATIPDAEPPPEGSEALAFAGLGTDAAAETTLHDAIRAALASLSTEENAGSAAVAGVVVLEDDPRLNAGTGVNLRIDGRTAEGDAAVMVLDEDGVAHFAAVAAVEGVKNPVLVAEKLLGAPTPVLSGFWARDFAARVGIMTEPAPQDLQQELYRTAIKAALADAGAPWQRLPWVTYVDPELRDGGLVLVDAASDAQLGEAGAATDAGDAQADALVGDAGADGSAPVAPSASAAPSSGTAPQSPPALPPKPPNPKPPNPKPSSPNPPSSAPKPPSSAAPAPSDTVAVLIRDANDRFAVAASSGGPPLALPGRIGDVPIYGAGIFVGPHGAVAVTGRGELIVELGLARRVYDRLALTRSARIAATWGAKQVPKDEQIGVAVLGKRDGYVARSAALAWLGWRDGKWKAPEDKP